MLSQSQANFFVNRPIFIDYPHLKEAFSNNSQEILQFLDEEDIASLKLTNKFFLDICDCHQLFSNTIKELGKLFSISVEPTGIEPEKKKSKFREKYNFNKPIGVYYKPPEKYTKSTKRIQSAKLKSSSTLKSTKLIKNIRYQIDANK